MLAEGKTGWNASANHSTRLAAAILAWPVRSNTWPTQLHRHCCHTVALSAEGKIFVSSSSKVPGVRARRPALQHQPAVYLEQMATETAWQSSNLRAFPHGRMLSFREGELEQLIVQKQTLELQRVLPCLLSASARNLMTCDPKPEEAGHSRRGP